MDRLRLGTWVRSAIKASRFVLGERWHRFDFKGSESVWLGVDRSGRLRIDGYDLETEKIAHALSGGVPSISVLVVETVQEEIAKAGDASSARRLLKQASTDYRFGRSPIGRVSALFGAGKPSYDVCLGIAAEPRIPRAVQMAMARHPDAGVRKALIEAPPIPYHAQLAMRRRLPPTYPREFDEHGYPVGWARDAEVWRILASDPSDVVRCIVASHPFTPMDVLIEMTRDRSSNVREQLLERHDGYLDQHLVNDPSEHVRARLAAETMNPDVIALLARDGDDQVRAKAAYRVELELLPELAGDESLTVRERIAARQDLPAELVELMRRDGSPWVRLLIRERYPKAVRRTRQGIARRVRPPDDPSERSSGLQI